MKITLGRLARELQVPMKDLKRLAEKQGLYKSKKTNGAENFRTPLYDTIEALRIAKAARENTEAGQ